MAIVDIAAELLGSDSLVGALGFDPLSLAGSIQGNATVSGELTEGTIFNVDVQFIQGIGYLTGDGGTADGLITNIPIAAFLEGNESVIGDGSVVDADEEEPVPLGPCEVEYDIEVCCVLELS